MHSDLYYFMCFLFLDKCQLLWVPLWWKNTLKMYIFNITCIYALIYNMYIIYLVYPKGNDTGICM